MKIITASAHRVHGYLDIAVEFNEDLTFIVGPNGSGKTTILYLMQLALSLSVDRLSRIKFSELVMDIQDDNGKRTTIIYTHSDDTINLFIPHLSKTGIPFRVINDDPYLLSFMRRDFMKNPKYSKIVEYFEGIKKPCFLNVERIESSLESNDDSYSDVAVRRKEIERSQKQRLKIVSDLIAGAFKEIADKRDIIQKELYTDIFMSLFTHNYRSQMQDPLLKPDVAKLQSIKSAVNQLIKKTFSAKDMDRYDDKVNQFFDNPPVLKNQKREISDNKGLMDILGYSFQLNRILALHDTYNEYNSRLDAINEPIRKFLSVLNEYYKDCDIHVSIDTLGRVVIFRPDGSSSGIHELSSGETQILIIFAHLIFGAYKNSRIFIIDEPELSLHLKWQEMLSRTIMSLSPTSQVILATHSPEIIGRYNHKAWNLRYHGKTR